MDKKTDALMKWVVEQRPDLIDQVASIIAGSNNGMRADVAQHFLISIGFEAGRQFQHENPAIEINNPSVYLA